jgi:hypothetical protein
LKPCPYCASQIEDPALQCPRCQRWLDPALDSTLNADSPPMVLPPRATNGLAIGSLACGLFWICGLGSVAGVILGYIALRQIRREPLRLKGRGMAIAGITLGWLGIVGLVVLISLGIHFWKIRGDHPEMPHSQPVHFTTASLL